MKRERRKLQELGKTVENAWRLGSFERYSKAIDFLCDQEINWNFAIIFSFGSVPRCSTFMCVCSRKDFCCSQCSLKLSHCYACLRLSLYLFIAVISVACMSTKSVSTLSSARVWATKPYVYGDFLGKIMVLPFARHTTDGNACIRIHCIAFICIISLNLKQLFVSISITLTQPHILRMCRPLFSSLRSCWSRVQCSSPNDVMHVLARAFIHGCAPDRLATSVTSLHFSNWTFINFMHFVYLNLNKINNKRRTAATFRLCIYILFIAHWPCRPRSQFKYVFRGILVKWN